MLYSETPEIHMHTMKIGVLVSGPEGIPLRSVPLKLHHPMWVVNDDIDFDYHVRQARVPAPGGRREPDQLIGDIASTPLDRSRPLWEMYVAEGLADDRIAIIHKVHHVLAAWLSYLPPALAPGMFRSQARRMESSSVMNLTSRTCQGRVNAATSRVRPSAKSFSRTGRDGQRLEHHGVELCRPARHLGAHRRPHP